MTTPAWFSPPTFIDKSFIKPPLLILGERGPTAPRHRKAMMTNRVTVVKPSGCPTLPPSLMLSRQSDFGENDDHPFQRNPTPDPRIHLQRVRPADRPLRL